MATLGVRLDDVLARRLQKLCQKTGRSKSYYAKQALGEFLNDREDYLLGLAALERQEKTISLDKLEESLGLDN